MQISGMLLVLAFCGQALDDTLPPGSFTPANPLHSSSVAPPAVAPPPTTWAEPAEAAVRSNPQPTAAASQQGRQPVRPPEMVAAALLLPAGSPLSGQPLTLANALSTTNERRVQLAVVQTYWGLVQALAEYHYGVDYVQTLAAIKPRSADVPTFRGLQASAAAQLRETELRVLRLQYELAALVQLPPSAALPLPADRPHVGAYRTSFGELFAGRTPPEPARLAEKILPLQHQVIEAQAAAVLAAEDARNATVEDYSAGRLNAAAVASCSAELLTQQREFMRFVCDYNRNIADYGLAVVGPAASPQALAAVLIGPPRATTSPDPAGQPVQAVGANEPIPTHPLRQPSSVAPGAAAVPSKNEPTLAPPRDGWKKNQPTPARPLDRMKTEPTLAPPRSGDVDREPSSSPSYNRTLPGGRNEPTLAPPAELPQGEPTTEAPLVPVDPQPQKPSPNTSAIPQTANKMAASSPEQAGSAFERSSQGSATIGLLYPGLVDASTAVQAKQLTAALHWDRSLPPAFGSPMTLSECLLRDAGNNRRETIEAYWQLRERAAEYQLLASQVEFYESLQPIALNRRNEDGGATEMLRLHAAQLAAQAGIRKSQAALIESQYALAMRIGALNDAQWPLASTIPHSGGYLMKLDARPRSLTEAWPVRRLAATLPGLSENVRQHAAAVVDADMARATAIANYEKGRGTLEEVLSDLGRQREQTLVFLRSLTEYNKAIAEYAVAVLPANMPAHQLVSALVMQP